MIFGGVQVKVFSLTLVFAAAFLFPALAGAQTYERLLRTTSERGLETLLEAVGTYDGGNFELMQTVGMLPGGSETHSITLQVLSDERVRKIFGLLRAMPQEEAASIVRQSYRKNLALLEETTLKNGAAPRSMSYGLHAKLWLSYQLDSLENFNRNFNDWNNWYVESLASERYLRSSSKDPEPVRKMSFASSAGPELMVYLNIVLNEKAKTGEIGDESEFAKKLQAAGMYSPLSKEYLMMKVKPFDAAPGERDDQEVEPLLEIPVFHDWAGLYALDIEKRAALISEVGKLIEEKGLAVTSLEGVAESILFLGGNLDVEALGRAKAKANRTGTLVEFIGSDSQERLAQGWYAERPPSKQRLVRAVRRMYKRTPIDERSDWDASIDELLTWLSEIPESGIELGKKKTFEWPERGAKAGGEESGSEAPDDLRVLRIRMELRKTKAFMGELEEADREPKRRSDSEDSPPGKSEEVDKKE